MSPRRRQARRRPWKVDWRSRPGVNHRKSFRTEWNANREAEQLLRAGFEGVVVWNIDDPMRLDRIRQ